MCDIGDLEVVRRELRVDARWCHAQSRSKMASVDVLPQPAAEDASLEEQLAQIEARELAAAIAASLDAAPAPAPASAPSAPAPSSENPFWAPARYVPAALDGDRTLSLVEDVQVRNGAYAWTPAKAFLDTGNQAMTILDARFAAAHGIYRADAGIPPEGWMTLRGVVPGASSQAPIVTIALKIRGQEYLIRAAVSELSGPPLLLGIDVLQQLLAAGFKISAGSA